MTLVGPKNKPEFDLRKEKTILVQELLFARNSAANAALIGK